MKTTIYLDFDGVLNAVSKRTPAPKISGWDNWEATLVRGSRVLFSPDMVSALNELAAHPDITFKWLTDWEDRAAKVISPAIGINGQEWEVLHTDQKCWRGLDWWKLQAIREDAAASDDHLFVWIDDEISCEVESITWARGRADVLTVSPSTVRGLTRADVERINHFTGAS